MGYAGAYGAYPYAGYGLGAYGAYAAPYTYGAYPYAYGAYHYGKRSADADAWGYGYGRPYGYGHGYGYGRYGKRSADEQPADEKTEVASGPNPDAYFYAGAYGAYPYAGY